MKQDARGNMDNDLLAHFLEVRQKAQHKRPCTVYRPRCISRLNVNGFDQLLGGLIVLEQKRRVSRTQHVAQLSVLIEAFPRQHRRPALLSSFARKERPTVGMHLISAVSNWLELGKVHQPCPQMGGVQTTLIVHRVNPQLLLYWGSVAMPGHNVDMLELEVLGNVTWKFSLPVILEQLIYLLRVDRAVAVLVQTLVVGLTSLVT